MTRMSLMTVCILLISGSLNFLAAKTGYDRQSLVELMDRYLAALVHHDPSRVPLSDDVKIIENTDRIAAGEGLWKTASSGPNAFKIYAADPSAGQVGFIGVIGVKGKPAILAARLKLKGDKICEIDHVVVYKETLPDSMMAAPRAGLVQPLKPSEKTARSEMLKAANAYYDAVVQVNGKLAPFAPQCQRRENGVTTANDHNQTAAEAAQDDFYPFRKMACSEQISTGIWKNITDMNRRRFIAVDEEMGLVFAYSIIVHDGEPKIMKITGVPGVTERPNKYGPFDLVAAHMFKIRNGKLHEIEAVGYMGEHGLKTGWE